METSKKLSWDFTVNIQGLVAALIFVGTLGGAWYTVKSDARNLATITDSRYTEFIQAQKESIEVRKELLALISKNNDDIRSDIKELRGLILINKKERDNDRSTERSTHTATQQPQNESQVYLGSRGPVERR